MSEQNKNAMTQQAYEPFKLPDIAAGEFDQADIDEDMDGLSMGFQRVKIPGGGVTQFEVPGDDPENPDYVKSLTGVILYNHMANAYWPEGEEYSNDTPPLCRSADGKTGYGDPGGDCASCALNQFGSVESGKGKACKNMRMLYLLQSGALLPLQLALPPTSIRPYQDFYKSAFLIRGRACYGSIVEIGLKKQESGGFTYSVATFRKVRDLEGEELSAMKSYVGTFREQARKIVEQRSEANKSAAESSVELGELPDAIPDNESRFTIGEGLPEGGVPMIHEKLPA